MIMEGHSMVWTSHLHLTFQFPSLSHQRGLPGKKSKMMCSAKNPHQQPVQISSPIDCDSFETFIIPELGVKIWLIAVLKNQTGAANSQQSFEDFASIGLFVKDYKLDQANTHFWSWVALVLKPGMTLWVLLVCTVIITYIDQDLSALWGQIPLMSSLLLIILPV